MLSHGITILHELLPRASGKHWTLLMPLPTAAALLLGSLSIALAAAAHLPKPPPTVVAIAETDPVADADDAADDPAIWVNPVDAGKSLILGTNKKSGLCVYDVTGHQLQFLPVGRINNVDVLQGITLGTRNLDFIAAGHRENRCIHLWHVDPTTLQLHEYSGSPLPVTVAEPYGIALGRGGSGETFIFVNDKAGKVEQWKLTTDSAGALTATLARTLNFKTQVEGMVCDDDLGFVYIGEEATGIWRAPINPASKDAPVLIAKAGKNEPIKPDTEGLAIYSQQGSTAGYLICSSQGNNTYAVFNRTPPNAYIGSFSIVDSATIDGCSDTDGIEATSSSLGSAYPFGVFIAQDGDNAGATQNFKMVPWDAVAKAFDSPLIWRAAPENPRK